ncbi:MAG: class IV adenylate cyclase [Calditrichaeota bacterium]|nr:class IV adenylate cyclase [Calditrichota bacterium]
MKAICSDLEQAEEIARGLGAAFQWERFQRDTFFRVPRGRLKLRETDNPVSELIAYLRPDTASEKWSDYGIVAVTETEKMKAILEKSLGILGCVEKRRKLFLLKNARIHLDRVKELGTFLEFEIVVQTAREENEAPIFMDFLKQHFQLREYQLVSEAYLDLLLKMKGPGRETDKGPTTD